MPFISRLTSPLIALQSKPLTEYLTTSGDQISEGVLTVDSLKTQFAKFEDTQTSHKVFGTKIGSSTGKVSEPNLDVFNNYPGTIRVDNLKIMGFINEKPIKQIEDLLTQLNGNVKYVGGMRFPNDVNVANLTFSGKFNGIPENEFGNCWLQQDRDQTFTAPQTLSNVVAGKGLRLSGSLNGHEFQEFVSGTYWINRNEHVKNAIFG